MPAPGDKRKLDRLNEVTALVATKVTATERDAVAVFVGLLYAQLDPEDAAQRSAEDLYGAALSLWRFASKRNPGRARLRVFSPTVADSGWASRHTVIEIVNDDMPFLVDSAAMEINRQGLMLHQIIHPVMAVERNKEGVLQAVKPRSPGQKTGLESIMHIEVDRLVDDAARTQLADGLERALSDVRSAVEDWPAMLQRLKSVHAELDPGPPGVTAHELAETRAFVDWLADDKLLLLGYRQQDLIDDDGGVSLRVVPGSGLGILRESPTGVNAVATSGSFAALPAQAREMAKSPMPVVIVTKANARSTVHRSGYTDYIGIKRYSAAGQVVGEHRFLGLLTSAAYAERASDTPLVRGKLAAVVEQEGLAPASHLGKALVHVLESYPRDELFQIDLQALREHALGILHLGERQRLRLFIRRDPFERFISCLIYVPRDAYSTEMRYRFIDILTRCFNGSAADFDVLLSDTVLARIHITVRTTPDEIPAYDRADVEARLAAASRRWEDELRDALVDELGEAEGLKLAKRYAHAFPPAYRETVAARAAVPDVRKMQTLSTAGDLGLSLYRAPESADGRLGFKLYHVGGPVVLSDSLPMLERMGARVMAEIPYRITPADGLPVWIHDIELQVAAADEVDLEKLAPLFEEAFAAVFSGRVENDEFNRLVLAGGLAADDVVILRAYAKYLRQTGFALSQSFIESTLSAHPHIGRMLVRLFKLRFDPTAADDAAFAGQAAAIEAALEEVANLSEDRVLRHYLGLVKSTLRTNLWRTGIGASGDPGPRRPFLSLKLDSKTVPGLPDPRPLVEIFVYSPRFEGIHLRGGRVARGGLRWSDRAEDFRTEVLGLVKAQIVKNTVIVPVGSKGGFVLKKAPPVTDRDAFMKEGISCYQDYLRALLDLTDNRVGDTVVPPPLVRRIDGDDPYLVVAADKGTATFSDFANAISAEYGHWLGDAFASGGSVGYDHKKMGITARGAWESVKRHFREIGIDIQTTDFTCVGVGDMSGDVFGNGMLLSKHTRLVAAFDHRHVFIDPDPDVAKSWVERQRLFDLPRSSWADYDSTLISTGGGIWPRSLKAIPVSPQAAAVLGISAGELTPADLISAILKAPVDLLYNGGIGTYIKASGESHAQVGDRANEAVRIDGRELRCKVVGEGGNLGMTQRARIEAAQNGVRLYTDAIDNSAGVDTSDHEVNIKIALGLAISDGEMTGKQRNTLLAEMTDDVAALVLRDNYFQTQIVSLTRRVGPRVLEQQARFIRFLEKQGRLARAIEFLPSDDEIASRKGQHQGLTNPEISVLLAYSKMWLYDEMLESNLPEDPWVGTAIGRYFPAKLRGELGETLQRHPLKREIVSTHVINSMINRVGVTFVHRLMEATGATSSQIVRAYLLARENFSHVEHWLGIEALDNVVRDEIQAQMLTELDHLTLRATRWFLRSKRLADPMAGTITRAKPGVDSLYARLYDERHAAVRNRLMLAAQPWIDAGVPAALAQRLAASDALVASLDVTELAESTQQPPERVADLLISIGELLDMPRLQTLIDALPAENYWHGLAKTSLTDDLADLQRTLTGEALSHAQNDDAQATLEVWKASEHGALERAQRLLTELAEAPQVDLAMLSVALRELRSLA
ncbi:MAG: NAD-glutamate dehydrogenase [Pseudomonadota bacterium]|nr:NAD-glutamate dehydrogenase [Pseudomonadota bacterium]